MKIIKEEDIFNVNERDRDYYTVCSTPYICSITNCCCKYNELVLPNKIGNNFKRTLKNKMYIWAYESCVICMNEILHKTDAYLSDCGHTFHKNCLTNWKHYIEIKSNRNLKCPMCRCNLGMPELNEKYNLSHKEANALDLLENINIEMIHICKSSKHYLGMNSKCNKCLEYRKSGFIN